MSRDELFFKYKDLVMKALHSVEYPLSLKKDLISVGYELLLILLNKIVNNKLKTTSDFNIEQYIVYRLKREYVREIIKCKHYWPGVKKLQTKVEYDTKYIDNDDRVNALECLPHENVCKKFLKRDIKYILDNFLTERQKDVLSLRYGINYTKGYKTYKEVSKIIGNSANAVCVSERLAINKIRKKCAYLKEYF